MRRYGERLGVVFQLVDDLIDVTSETGESGKTPGTDLREGVATLPVLYARTSTDPADARLLELLGQDLRDNELHAEALGLLRAHPALDRARERTLEMAREAQDLIDPLGAGPVQDALRALAVSIVQRVR